MKIYTKTGDKGKTCLVGGKRVAKNDPRLEAYGTIDELNSFIGLLASRLESDKKLREYLQGIQHNLFRVGGMLAVDESHSPSDYGICLEPEHIECIEREIDRVSELLPPLKSFVIPGGTPEAALCHVCRTVARRAERRICEVGDFFEVCPEVLMYVNRLSDYFFVLSRFFNMQKDGEKLYLIGE